MCHFCFFDFFCDELITAICMCVRARTHANTSSPGPGMCSGLLVGGQAGSDGDHGGDGTRHDVSHGPAVVPRVPSPVSILPLLL